MIAMDISKMQPIYGDPMAIQQNFLAGNLNRQNAEDQNKNVNTIMFFIIKEAKVTIFDFHQEL